MCRLRENRGCFALDENCEATQITKAKRIASWPLSGMITQVDRAGEKRALGSEMSSHGGPWISQNMIPATIQTRDSGGSLKRSDGVPTSDCERE